MNAISFEQVVEVKNVVDGLIPGYYRRAVDPFEALENREGNCFTNAVVGAVVLHSLYGVEASMAWSPRLHATEMSGMFSAANSSSSKDTVAKLNISHIELLVPRGLDRFDVLGVGWGMKVAERADGFEKKDLGGVITNYNFPDRDPRDLDVIGIGDSDDPLVQIDCFDEDFCDGEIIATDYGKELGLACMDWELAANDYRFALGLDELNLDALVELLAAKHAAWTDWCEINGHDQ